MAIEIDLGDGYQMTYTGDPDKCLMDKMVHAYHLHKQEMSQRMTHAYHLHRQEMNQRIEESLSQFVRDRPLIDPGSPSTA